MKMRFGLFRGGFLRTMMVEVNLKSQQIVIKCGADIVHNGTPTIKSVIGRRKS